MKKILIVANYKGHVGGISGQVEMLYNCLNKGTGSRDYYTADIYSTQGCIIKRICLFVKLLLVASRYDVIHMHGCSERGFLPIVYGVIAGKLWRKRMIVTYHGGDADKYFSRHSSFVKRWLGRADKVIVLNGYLEKVFKKYGISCIVIPNIIELSEIQEHSDYQWDAPRLISVRHLRELYNIQCALQAYANIKKQLPNATFTILGEGPLRKDLENFVEKNGVEDVTFVGQVDNKEMQYYLKQSDIMLSTPHIDNMPVSLMEAMNAKVLVISTNVGGVPYMIKDGVTGMLFKDDDAEELATKILQVVHYPKQTMEMISQAHNEVKKYSWEEICKQLLPLYND